MRIVMLLRFAMAALAVLVASCGPGEPESRSSGKSAPKQEGIRIAILADDGVNPMRNYQTVLLEKLVKTRPRMEVSTVHAGGDAEVQARQVREAVRAGARFIMVFPQDAARLAPALREAVIAGVRVFAFSPDVPEDACTCIIFTDERALGRMAGEYVVAALKTKAEGEGLPAPRGRVVLLRGDETSDTCRRYAEGFLSATQQAPGIVLVHDAPADWSDKSAADRIREALRLQKQFDVIYAQNDLMAAGASRAIREADPAMRDAMLVLGTDGVPGKGSGVSMVLSGELDATVYQPPLVDLAWRELQSLLDKPGATVPKRLQAKPFMITPENAARIQRDGLPAPEVQ